MKCVKADFSNSQLTVAGRMVLEHPTVQWDKNHDGDNCHVH